MEERSQFELCMEKLAQAFETAGQVIAAELIPVVKKFQTIADGFLASLCYNQKVVHLAYHAKTKRKRKKNLKRMRKEAVKYLEQHNRDAQP